MPLVRRDVQEVLGAEETEGVMKIVAMLEKADGNAETGTAWTETAIFDSTQQLADVLLWAQGQVPGAPKSTRRGRLTLDIADQCDRRKA